MATDASGWGSSFSQTTPWHDSLISSLQNAGQTGQTDSMANDPLSTTNPSSAARMLGSATPAAQTGGTLAQSLTGGATASSAGAYPTFNMMQKSAAAPIATQAAPAAVAQATAPTLASRLTVSQGTPLTANAAAVAPQATGATDYSHVGTWNNSYTGPQVVSVRTQDGNNAYYSFDPKTGGYTLSGVYDKDGYALNSGSKPLASLPAGATTDMVDGASGFAYGRLPNGNQWQMSNGVLTELTHVNGLTADQRAGAAQTSLGGGVQVQDTSAGNAGILNNLNQAYSSNVDTYKTGYGAQQTQATATATQAQQASDSSYILNYMVQNGGALPPVYKPGMSGVPMSQAAFDAAAAEYKANNSSQIVNSISLQAPDTSAVDQNGLAALLSLNSQYQTGANGADNAAQQNVGNTNAAYQAGQNTLAHNSDYADKFNTNLGIYSDAVTKQGAADVNATGQKLNQDIQAMSDMLNQLQQSAQQLGTTSQQSVSAAIRNLQNQITDYQASASQLGANNANVAAIAKGILSAGGQIATAGVA